VKLLYFFKQNVSGNENLPINGHTIFNTDTNESVFGVQCNYSNIVNNKKKYSTLYAKIDS